MLQATRKVNGKILWANMILLFWLSLVPFATGWMGENHFAPLPTAVYGFILLMCAIFYTILQSKIVKHDGGENDLLAAAVGKDVKGKISLVCYIIAIPMAFFATWVSWVLFVAVAAIWFMPDRRIEKKIH